MLVRLIWIRLDFAIKRWDVHGGEFRYIYALMLCWYSLIFFFQSSQFCPILRLKFWILRTKIWSQNFIEFNKIGDPKASSYFFFDKVKWVTNFEYRPRFLIRPSTDLQIWKKVTWNKFKKNYTKENLMDRWFRLSPQILIRPLRTPKNILFIFWMRRTFPFCSFLCAGWPRGQFFPF